MRENRAAPLQFNLQMAILKKEGDRIFPKYIRMKNHINPTNYFHYYFLFRFLENGNIMLMKLPCRRMRLELSNGAQGMSGRGKKEKTTKKECVEGRIGGGEERREMALMIDKDMELCWRFAAGCLPALPLLLCC